MCELSTVTFASFMLAFFHIYLQSLLLFVCKKFRKIFKLGILNIF